MLLAILSGFLIAICLLFLGKQLKGNLPLAVSILPITLFVYFCTFLPGIGEGQTFFQHIPWIPSMGIHLDFKLDGLSLLFSLLITGIGSLVFLYSSSYLKGHIYIGRFYGYLCVFMASMLGVVLSDNLLVLFVFWELTAISSFFLIGFNNDNEASRKSSLLAWAITGGGGFFLMAGFILIGNVSGTYSLQEMLSSSELLKSHFLYAIMLFLIFAGAFTKSAQFPFHFWLPGAMKAPTPVSAYLHSATMVKAGIYLIARFTPILGNHPYWNNTLLIVGGITMVYGAFHSIFRIDLKGILAYSTISALGILVFLLGIGTHDALLAASVFILVHAFYKAGLFLIAGVIDHETGTRDVSQLAGLRKVMAPLAIAGGLAALSSAGIPLTLSFVSKDLIYEATLNSGNSALLFTLIAILTNIFLSYSGYLAGIKPFVGSLPAKFSEVHLPSGFMWLPPLFLGLGGLLFGLFPSLLDSSLIQPVIHAMGANDTVVSLKLWHGFNTVLMLSALTIVCGIILYLILKPSLKRLNAIGKLDSFSPQTIFMSLAKGTKFIALRYTKFMHNGFLRSYLTKIIFFLVCLIGYYLIRNVDIQLYTDKHTAISMYEAIVFSIMIVAIFTIVFSPSRFVAIISLSVMGYCMCLFFVYYGAPDLAMTQFTIDTLTTVLFVLVLLKLPPYLRIKDKAAQVRDGFLAGAFGILISVIALQVLNEPTNKNISRFYADNAYLLGKGKNVVNVILVDFRGYDTLVEITVLTIAAIGVYSMLKIQSSEIE
ncbi:putative monovalent cation/H+ antiporter subunit A [Albibacterium bauzanense]|uniref:Multisubunit sodium/proton antiporter MrpA subunit n=1 Tax=Albibacterium bauzanense TaxID=653929 RepID=A0A4R1LXY0_9SPHI|nr:putative monovalent cation/H+ antiporter subunit A [Albibacterium bauzanense]TCK83430.1 multisubunit sodium/proton antiporter MrpA subunit [Albibacterium bauzanense]